MNNSDMPAMPLTKVTEESEYNGCKYVESKEGFEGLTKREHFAGLAMQGFIAAGVHGMPDSTIVARRACAYADMLLAELSK
tara:strand:+ start:323 stop:565 length:243 start_codon:yes stop_codon:yes gene_type:complete